ncbi:hypothetical protein [Agromyces aureus]|uniref:Fimbrial assembly protein n=1 Tax=Agromyces aureus TaxID=453304 RepID=A0A191WIA9_9MICO|nr:hypothetical protein [Agromyces aureus]ANJ27903.1 hypothetical protein ATC03_15440 [Agromyces aureus]
MSAKGAGDAIIAAEPRASLLPEEIRTERAVKRTRRGLVFGVLGTFVVAALAIGAMFALQVQASVQLALSQAHTTSLLQQQTEYGEIRELRSNVMIVSQAQQIGASTEIDWRDYLAQVQATLPVGVVVTQADIDSATPMTPYAQSTAPLQGERVATIAFTATSPTLPDVPVWLDSLATLPGYADALPGEVTAAEEGAWTVTITMHVDQSVFTKRFAPPTDAASEPAADGTDATKDGE